MAIIFKKAEALFYSKINDKLEMGGQSPTCSRPRPKSDCGQLGG